MSTNLENNNNFSLPRTHKNLDSHQITSISKTNGHSVSVITFVSVFSRNWRT